MAATAGSVRAGRAHVEIWAEDSKLHGALQAAQNRMRAFGSSVTKIGAAMAGAGAAITAPLVAATKAYIDAASAMVDMSDRTGVSVKALSGLAFAAEQSGTDVNALEVALKAMAKGVDAAAQGGDAATAVFDRLGLNVADLLRLKPEQRFLTLAEALSKIEDPGERAALAMKVFGKSGTALLPMLADGRAGIEAMTERAAELGRVMDDDSARAAEALGDKIDQLKSGLQGVVTQIGAALIPILDDFVNKLLAIAPAISDWISDNQGLVRFIVKVGVGATATGLALVGVGQAIGGISTAIGGLQAGIDVFRGLSKSVGLADDALTMIMTTGGIGLIVVGVGAAVAALVVLQEKFGIFDPAIEAVEKLAVRLEGRLTPAFEQIGESIGRVFQALEPLVPLIEQQMVQAVEALAFVLETLVIPQIEIMAQQLEIALSIARQLPGAGAILGTGATATAAGLGGSLPIPVGLGSYTAPMSVAPSISNSSDVARGGFSKEDVQDIKTMLREIVRNTYEEMG